MSRQLVIYPDPILTRKTEPVTQFNRWLNDLADEMIQIMTAAPGLGLAAPQAGESKSLLVADTEVIKSIQAEQQLPSLLAPDLPRFIALCNPKIVGHEGTTEYIEGCLSLPDIHEIIDRHQQITVAWQDLSGNPQITTADGLLAIVLQHEIDHLDGILLLDRISPLKRELYRKRLIKRSKQSEPTESFD